MLRIASSQVYETIINKRPKSAQLKQLSPLENLTRQFEKRTGLKIAKLERTVPFIVSPWWVPPKKTIAQDKSEAKQNHDQIALNPDPQHHIIVYTDGSGINGKIGAAAVAPSQGTVCKAFLGPSYCFTVYSGELQGVAMALNIVLSQTNSQIRKVIIFTDNQGAIRSAGNPLRQSGQQILRFIASSIDMLREHGIDLEIHWIPAHNEIVGNELADLAAKEATGWRKVKRRNGKLREIDTNYTAHQTPLPFLRSDAKAHFTKLLYEKWGEEWRHETRGRALFKITPSPTGKVLHIHDKLPKWVSSLMIQMRTGKIGLRRFLYERKEPGVEIGRCGCKRGEETVRHVLTEGPRFKEMRRTLWAREVRKARLNWIDLRTILVTPIYAKKTALFMQKTDLLGQF